MCCVARRSTSMRGSSVVPFETGSRRIIVTSSSVFGCWWRLLSLTASALGDSALGYSGIPLSGASAASAQIWKVLLYANVELCVWERVPRIREMNDNRAFGGKKGAFCFGMRLASLPLGVVFRFALKGFLRQALRQAQDRLRDRQSDPAAGPPERSTERSTELTPRAHVAV